MTEPTAPRSMGANNPNSQGAGAGSQSNIDPQLAAIQRTPPQDNAAEQAVLGAMITSKEAIAEVISVVKGRDFYQPSHEMIFEAVLELYSAGKPADMVTVADQLARDGLLERAGGRPYLIDLVQSVSVLGNASRYAEIVHDKALLRRLVDASVRIGQLGHQGIGDVEKIVDNAQQIIYEVAEIKESQDYEQLSDLLVPTMDQITAIWRDEVVPGVPTGLADLDNLINGFQPGQMIIVAARPGAGKSTAALDFCRSASIKNGLTSAFFSLEMSKYEIVMRLLSAEAGVHLSRITGSQKLTDDEWDSLENTSAKIAGAPLFIDDSPNLTMMEIRAKARRLKQRHDVRLIVIDYIQLMSSGKKVESRQLEVSEFSRQIKLLAKELQIPIIALSQLNRGPEQRSDKKPALSDLRESGSLEQDADVVILVHRDDLGNDKSERKGEADMIVAKHRNGPTSTIPVVFQGHYSRFVDLYR